MINKRSTALERSLSKKLIDGLNVFNGTNLTLCSDLDQGTHVKVTNTENAKQKRAKMSALTQHRKEHTRHHFNEKREA